MLAEIYQKASYRTLPPQGHWLGEDFRVLSISVLSRFYARFSVIDLYSCGLLIYYISLMSVFPL